MEIAIVTDSTSDIPEDLAAQYHIQVVPNLLLVEGQSLEDGIGITRQAFYERLPMMQSFPTTGTASSGTYQLLYDRLFTQGAKFIISIHPSNLLSGILNAASTAAQAFGERVRVIDSQSVSLGLGFQAIAAAEAVWRGLGLEAVLSLLQEMPPRVRVVALLDTLEYVRRSGRVSWARARLGEFLHIKPFIEVRNGIVHSLGEVRTRRKGIERLQQLLHYQGVLERLAILHTNAEEEAQQFLDDLKLDSPSPIAIVNVTTVVGAHIGPKCLGFAAVTK
jgi:DegV family protein with EDD domain